jgi:hypothetical protein
MNAKIDTFLDLEGLGVGKPGSETGVHVEPLLQSLPDSLAELGYELGKLWGTACSSRKRGHLSGEVQIAVNQMLKGVGGVMHWTRNIADEALKDEVLRHLDEGSLAPSVLLVANDCHFVPLVTRVRQAGHRVVVSGEAVSLKLLRVASEVIPLSTLTRTCEPFVPPRIPGPFNGILFP